MPKNTELKNNQNYGADAIKVQLYTEYQFGLDRAYLSMSFEQLKQLKEFSDSLNIDKNLGDRGSNLSGGQRQRVSISRSFFSNRQILIMDESTNALDEENEKYILDYLNTLKKDISIVLISHNIEMLKNCDRIYKIENKHLKKIK